MPCWARHRCHSVLETGPTFNGCSRRCCSTSCCRSLWKRLAWWDGNKCPVACIQAAGAGSSGAKFALCQHIKIAPLASGRFGTPVNTSLTPTWVYTHHHPRSSALPPSYPHVGVHPSPQIVSTTTIIPPRGCTPITPDHQHHHHH
jgi:hypothetical protein